MFSCVLWLYKIGYSSRTCMLWKNTQASHTEELSDAGSKRWGEDIMAVYDGRSGGQWWRTKHDFIAYYVPPTLHPDFSTPHRTVCHCTLSNASRLIWHNTVIFSFSRLCIRPTWLKTYALSCSKLYIRPTWHNTCFLIRGCAPDRLTITHIRLSCSRLCTRPTYHNTDMLSFSRLWTRRTWHNRGMLSFSSCAPDRLDVTHTLSCSRLCTRPTCHNIYVVLFEAVHQTDLP